MQKPEYYKLNGLDPEDQRLITIASGSIPFLSPAIYYKGDYYLDGGCSENIPLGWVKHSGEDKVVVVKTREHDFRREPGVSRTAKIMYRNYPEFLKSFADTGNTFNKRVEELSKKSKENKVFVIEPSEEVTVTRFEGDMEKLGELYWLGFNDTKKRIGPLKDYLAR